MAMAGPTSTIDACWAQGAVTDPWNSMFLTVRFLVKLHLLTAPRFSVWHCIFAPRDGIVAKDLRDPKRIYS